MARIWNTKQMFLQKLTLTIHLYLNEQKLQLRYTHQSMEIGNLHNLHLLTIQEKELFANLKIQIW